MPDPPSAPEQIPESEQPPDAELPLPSFDDDDVEAGARMIASENPHKSQEVHIEQVWTQIREAQRHHQSLYQRITGGAGYGSQGGKRPVSTAQPANDAQRQLVREILQGQHPSVLPMARKWFEPGQQDAAFQIAERARAKQAQGEPLTAQETRLLKYHYDADGIRQKWTGEGAQMVESVDGLEFYT